MAKKNFGKSQQEQLKFRKANKAKKRVMIARDVIAQLNANRFIASPGEWARFDGLEKSKENTELCDLLAKNRKCEVCGVGALFVSAVEHANRISVADVKSDLDSYDLDYNEGIEQSTAFEYLEQYFDKEQLDLIEQAFEQGKGVTYTNSDDGLAARRFCDHEDDQIGEYLDDRPHLRMRLIMENIIANNGTFVPSKKPISYLKVVFETEGYNG